MTDSNQFTGGNPGRGGEIALKPVIRLVECSTVYVRPEILGQLIRKPPLVKTKEHAQQLDALSGSEPAITSSASIMPSPSVSWMAEALQLMDSVRELFVSILSSPSSSGSTDAATDLLPTPETVRVASTV